MTNGPTNTQDPTKRRLSVKAQTRAPSPGRHPMPSHHHRHHLRLGGHRSPNASVAASFIDGDGGAPSPDSPSSSSLLPFRSEALLAAAADLLPHGRSIELLLLALALGTCAVMYIVARVLKRSDSAENLSPRSGKENAAHEAAYRGLRNTYLSVYALAVFGDWIQGGFLYALYAEYGYSIRDIGLIFVVGYASAMTIGTYVAALGDTGGHRRNCVAYGLLYAGSCVLCNCQSLALLLLGRVLGGVAYSILYVKRLEHAPHDAYACTHMCILMCLACALHVCAQVHLLRVVGHRRGGGAPSADAPALAALLDRDVHERGDGGGGGRRRPPRRRGHPAHRPQQVRLRLRRRRRRAARGGGPRRHALGRAVRRPARLGGRVAVALVRGDPLVARPRRPRPRQFLLRGLALRLRLPVGARDLEQAPRA